MIKLEEMDLRKYFSTEREYLKFLDDYPGRIEILLDKYNFLGFREEKWKNLITATISNLVSVKTSTINSAIQNYLDEYIKNEIKLLRPRIVCNLIILNFKNKKFKDAIVGFSSDLKKFKISINYEFFTILKEENVFKKIFGKEPITYEEFKFILSNNYEKYNKFKTLNRDILWTYQKTNHLLSLMKLTMNNINDEQTRKIKFVLNHWDYIAEIEKYLLKFNIRVPLDAVLLTILNYREDEIEDLREGLFKYKLEESDTMPPFVSKIQSRCKKNITIINPEKVEQKEKKTSLAPKIVRGGVINLKVYIIVFH